MQNIKTALNGNILTIQIDVTQDLGLSKSGKSKLIASTQGNQTVKGAVGGDVIIGINCYRKA